MPPDGSRFNISIGDLTKWLEWRSDRDLNGSIGFSGVPTVASSIA
jgi:hypothetical protein